MLLALTVAPPASAHAVLETTDPANDAVVEEAPAQVELPASADPEAPPVWEKVTDGTTWEWHDHRIHWMSTIPPPQVRALPERRHHILDWFVPAELDGQPLAIRGSLDYLPPRGGGTSRLVWLAPIGVGVRLAAVGAWVALRARSRAGGRT